MLQHTAQSNKDLALLVCRRSYTFCSVRNRFQSCEHNTKRHMVVAGLEQAVAGG
jgi:hypothetical protein